MTAARLTEDGHVLVVSGDDVRIECPVGGCDGPYVACGECEGDGRLYDRSERGRICPECRETGMDGGEHTCWFATDFFDARESLDDPVPPPGRYVLRYDTDGHYDSLEAQLFVGPPADTTEEGS